MPVQAIPAWMDSRVQPIAVVDVVEALVGALRLDTRVALVRRRRTRADAVHARCSTCTPPSRGLTRPQVTVPGLPTDLVGALAGAITDVPASTVEALVESLRHDMVCHDVDWTYDLLPLDHRLVGVDESFARALAEPDEPCRPPSATRWARCRATRGGPAGRAAGWRPPSPAPGRSPPGLAGRILPGG